MTKTLVLIRHAHRDTTDRSADNGLSEKGVKQAAALLRYYVKAFGDEESKNKPRIFSSPKRRCVETVTSIAREAGVRVETSSEFLEQGTDESLADMRKRAEKFVEKWKAEKNQNELTIVCSHGDWLPAALQAAMGGRVELKKGAWAELRIEERGLPRLEWLIQSFKNRF
jgi:broad specificity phosphatase PhoE